MGLFDGRGIFGANSVFIPANQRAQQNRNIVGNRQGTDFFTGLFERQQPGSFGSFLGGLFGVQPRPVTPTVQPTGTVQGPPPGFQDGPTLNEQVGALGLPMDSFQLSPRQQLATMDRIRGRAASQRSIRKLEERLGLRNPRARRSGRI